MKSSRLFFGVLSSLCLLCYVACEKSTQVSSDLKIVPRVDDCDECDPEEDCCCYIKYVDDMDPARFFICGIQDGFTGCSSFSTSAGPCYVMQTPLGYQVALNPNHIQYFCVAKGENFAIQNMQGGTALDVLVKCSGDATEQALTLPAGLITYFMTGGDGCYSSSPCAY